MEFNFTNEQIVFIYKHFSDYLNLIDNRLLKELKYSQGQLELAEKIFGDSEDFNKEEHALHMRLLKEELPKVINERREFAKGIRDIFSPMYDAILDNDTLFVDDIEHKYFGSADSITDLLNQIKDKQNGFDEN